MFLDVKELTVRKARIQKTYPAGTIDFHSSEFRQLEPLEVRATAELVEGQIRISGHFHTRLEMVCPRCLDTVVEEIIGDARVSGLRLKNLKDGTASTLTVVGVFIYVGLRPNTGWLAGLITLTDDGLIVSNDLMETTLPGVFGAGDVRKKLLRQITTAVGDGATAAFAAEKYVQTF